MIYFTSICANYLPKAMALAESVKRHCVDAKFVLCLVEREVPEVASSFPHFDQVVLAKDAGWESFDVFMFRHSIVEASTAVKPRFMQHLFETFVEHDKFVYLDPDVLVYSDLTELNEILETESIVLCPHLLRPGNIDMEISSLAHGSYNLGFLGLRRSDNATSFLSWWAERLFKFCYDDKARGIFTDQKWVDLAPSFFDVFILKHHGYDFATWSLLNSDLRHVGDSLMVNGDALRFIHFSGLDSGTIDKAIGWWLTDENRAAFVELYHDYKLKLESHGQSTLGKLAWSYANYSDGSAIGKEARIAYRDAAMWEKVPQPFSSSDREIAVAASSESQDAHSGDAVSVLPEESVLPSAQVPGILSRISRSVQSVGVRRTIFKAVKRAFNDK